MMLGARTAAWAKSGAPLPYYAEVEYLESTGTQYIETGVNMKNTVGIAADFMKTASGDIVLMGSRNDSTGQWLNTSNYNFYIRFGSGYFTAKTGNPLNVRTNAMSNIFNSRKAVIDGVDLVSTYYLSKLTDGPTIYLFAAHRAGITGPNLPFIGRIYSAMITDGDEVVRDFVPVKFKNENGKYEGVMYDRLGVGGMNPDGTVRNDGIYRNIGIGSFVIGPPKA